MTKYESGILGSPNTSLFCKTCKMLEIDEDAYIYT